MTQRTFSIKGVCAAFLISFASIPAFGWGQTGHDVTCEIASRHLTSKAKKEVARILDGKSMVYWANWMDGASHTPEYAWSACWHYRNVDAGLAYPGEINPKGDVVLALENQIAALKSDTLSRDAEFLALKMVIHFAGDVHCPMHLGHKSDLGGNKYQLQFFGKGTNLHSIFDSGIIERGHRWSYSEWADQLDVLDRKTVAEIMNGTPYEWGEQTFAITTRIYESTAVGAKLSYDYVSTWLPDVEQQLLYGGLRLAGILNDIYK